MHKKVPTSCGLEGGRGLWCHSVERDGTVVHLKNRSSWFKTPNTWSKIMSRYAMLCHMLH